MTQHDHTPETVDIARDWMLACDAIGCSTLYAAHEELRGGGDAALRVARQRAENDGWHCDASADLCPQHTSRAMEPVKIDQTILAGDPKRKGNCVAACVATLTGEPLDRVPHFIEFGIAYGDSDDVAEVSHGHNWWAMMLGFLAARGLWVVELDGITAAESTEFVLVAGMSPRGVMHQVIYRAGRLWHDPHPSRAGVLDVQEALAVRPLPGFDHAPTVPTAACGGA